MYINDVAWMAENLNYKTPNSEYYNNDSIAYSEKYGRLYTWEEAMNSCPTGWKLPTDDDWMKLEEATGMKTEEIIDNHIRGWTLDQVLEGGIQGMDITFSGYKWGESWTELDNKSVYWTSTQQGEGAYCRGFQSSMHGINRFVDGDNMKYSVRCIPE